MDWRLLLDFRLCPHNSPIQRWPAQWATVRENPSTLTEKVSLSLSLSFNLALWDCPVTLAFSCAFVLSFVLRCHPPLNRPVTSPPAAAVVGCFSAPHLLQHHRSNPTCFAHGGPVFRRAICRQHHTTPTISARRCEWHPACHCCICVLRLTSLELTTTFVSAGI